MRQLKLIQLPPLRKEHGGSLSQGRRKLARPVDTRRPIHLVLRSTCARGGWSMLKPTNRRRIEHLANVLAPKFGLRIYRFANVGNHLHLLVKCQTHEGFKGFLRLFSGKVALLVTGAKKGKPQGKFWDSLAYSRLIAWGKEFDIVRKYLLKNIAESFGAWRAGMKIYNILDYDSS